MQPLEQTSPTKVPCGASRLLLHAQALTPDAAGEEPSSPGSRSRAAYLERLQATTSKAQAAGMSVVRAGELLATLRPLIYTLALYR